jgi:hypothetical protein
MVANPGVAEPAAQPVGWGCMKARYKTKDAPGRSGNGTNQGVRSWPLLPGILLADFGLLLIGLAGWDALEARMQTLLYSGGGILCLGGLILIWTGTMKLAAAAREPAVRSKDNCLAQIAPDSAGNLPDFDWRSRPIHVALRH